MIIVLTKLEIVSAKSWKLCQQKSWKTGLKQKCSPTNGTVNRTAKGGWMVLNRVRFTLSVCFITGTVNHPVKGTT